MEECNGSKVSKEFHSTLENAYVCLEKSWDELGLSSFDQQKEFKKLESDLIKSINSKVETENNRVLEMEKEVSELYQKVDILRDRLDGKFKTEMEMKETRLHKKHQSLRHTYGYLLEEEKSRQGRKADMTEKLQSLQICLGDKMSKFSTPCDDISINYISEFQREISLYEKEKDDRKLEMEPIFAKIRTLWKTMDLGSDQMQSSFEQELFETGLGFSLTPEFKSKMNNLQQQLNQQKILWAKEKLSLVQKIDYIWKRIEDDRSCQQNPIVESQQSILTRESIAKLEQELDRLTIKRKVVLEDLIEKSTGELLKIYQDCNIAVEIRKGSVLNCPTKNDEDADFQYLDSLRDEIQTMQIYKEKTAAISQTIEVYNEKLKEMTALEIRSKDPKRFTNRGGGLLKEEKLRKSLLKDIPHLKEKLITLISTWETEQGCHFVIGTERYLTTLQGIEDTNKENFKKSKTSKPMKTPSKNDVKPLCQSSRISPTRAPVQRQPFSDISRTPKQARNPSSHHLSRTPVQPMPSKNDNRFLLTRTPGSKVPILRENKSKNSVSTAGQRNKASSGISNDL